MIESVLSNAVWGAGWFLLGWITRELVIGLDVVTHRGRRGDARRRSRRP